MIKKILIGVSILCIAVLAILYFSPLRKKTAFIQTAINQVAGPGCPNGSLFSVSPIDLSEFISITPLGNLSPPDHTIPTDHIYVVLKTHNNIDLSNAKNVHAPGNITITRINHNTALKQGAVWSDDYGIDFSPCNDVRINFGHVNTISDELKSVFEKAGPSCDTQIPREGDEYTYCTADMNYAVKAGVVLGTAGSGTSTGLDIQAIDDRSEKLAYANPKRYRNNSFHFVCPLDLFEPTVQKSLYDRLGSTQSKRTTEPRCGEVSQDISGSAQGNWITGVDANDLIDEPGNWDKSLALVHDNFDPSVGIASIGGVIGQSGQIAFTPNRDGTINRAFSEVKADSVVYCYYSDAQAGSGNVIKNQRLLIQLTTAVTMQAELQNGGCSSSVSFSKPTTYER